MERRRSTSATADKFRASPRDRFTHLGSCERGNALDTPSGEHRQGGAISNMLVLTRKSNQSIMIGDDIEVSVLSIMGEKVRIGIQAPRDIPVFRKEVYLEIQEERGTVAAPTGDGARRGGGRQRARRLGEGR